MLINVRMRRKERSMILPVVLGGKGFIVGLFCLNKL